MRLRCHPPHEARKERGHRVALKRALALLLLALAFSACSGTQAAVPPSSGTAYATTHSVPAAELGDAAKYWNTDWKGRAAELHHDIAAVSARYFQSQRHLQGDGDCNDMAVEVWGLLLERGIASVLVVGNLERSGETYADCNHAWLLVYSAEGSSAALELTSGRTYTWADTQANPRLTQYWEGFIYERPADLWMDFAERW